MTAGAVTVRDRGYDELMRRIAGARQLPVVDVGVLGADAGASHPGGPLTVADVATWNEFGMGVPERSFIRAYVDGERDRIEGWLTEAAKRVISLELPTFEAALELIGWAVRNAIVARIDAHIDPPNAQVTMDRKGSSTPLVDTGQLRSSITHLVRQPNEAA